MNWFQTIFNRRQSSINNNRHGIIYKGLLHLLNNFSCKNSFFFPYLFFLSTFIFSLCNFFFNHFFLLAIAILLVFFFTHVIILLLYASVRKSSDLRTCCALHNFEDELSKFNEFASMLRLARNFMLEL